MDSGKERLQRRLAYAGVAYWQQGHAAEDLRATVRCGAVPTRASVCRAGAQEARLDPDAPCDCPTAVLQADC